MTKVLVRCIMYNSKMQKPLQLSLNNPVTAFYQNSIIDLICLRTILTIVRRRRDVLEQTRDQISVVIIGPWTASILGPKN